MPEQIEQYMRTLKLGGMAREWRNVEFQYVRELLELELREREVNRLNRMVKTAGFQVIKTLEDFVWNQNIELPVGLTREYMEGLQFLPQKENLIFLGSVGTGKTHLATAIAVSACLKSSNEDGNEGKRENLSRNIKFAFTIIPKSAEFVEPAEKTLYHPAAWQNDKLV